MLKLRQEDSAIVVDLGNANAPLLRRDDGPWARGTQLATATARGGEESTQHVKRSAGRAGGAELLVRFPADPLGFVQEIAVRWSS